MRYFNFFIAGFLLFITSFISAQSKLEDYIYQYSSKQAFFDKKYNSDLTLTEVSKFGDFGLGTLNGVNGELVIWDGKFFRVSYEGEVLEQALDKNTPFSVIKKFEADTSFQINETIDLARLRSTLDQLVTDKAVAVKIIGNFSYLKTRSVQKQNKPYPNIQSVVANQAVFEFENTRAGIIGFWFPEYFDGVNFPGYHFHCLIDGKKGGGHLLDCNIDNAIVEIDYSEGVIVDY